MRHDKLNTSRRTLAAAALLCVLLTPGQASLATDVKGSGFRGESEGRKYFEQLKALAGSWEGRVKTTPNVPAMEGKVARVSLRVTSTGNALMHDLSTAGLRDNPITMFYLEDDRLALTHYCDAGNRPRMAAKISPDGKTIEFDFLDVAGGNHRGHMHNVVFTFIDGNHHTEDWTYMMPGDKPMRAHFDLWRSK